MVSVGILLVVTGDVRARDGGAASHPPLRKPFVASKRPLSNGRTYFVDPVKGNDSPESIRGSQQEPWKTIQHAVERLTAGDTLYLRGGTYYENLVVALVGKPGSPIVIQGYPGEIAVLDGGWREFFENPADCWEPFPGGGPGEYRSKKKYPNQRDVLGAFSDSMIALHTYWHAKDLRATNELWIDKGDENLEPIYIGPGLWYDAETGHIHIRLAHTHIKDPRVPNYQGENDPRKLPLLIRPFRAAPLTLDRAIHVEFRDLVIRGGGCQTVMLQQAAQVAFDNVMIYTGAYGVRANCMVGLRMRNCAVYGMMPPWVFRSEMGLMLAQNKPHRRDISRMIGRALMVAEGEGQDAIFYHPMNQDWEISQCEFTDGVDGLFLGGVHQLRFHHNLVDNMLDDGIYITSMYDGANATMRIYQNIFSRAVTVFALGGNPQSADTVYIYRNIVDLRKPIQHGRPRPKDGLAVAFLGGGKPIGDHGGPLWPNLFICQNTIIAPEDGVGRWAQNTLAATSAARDRVVMNNVFVQANLTEGVALPPLDHKLRLAGNLYWGVKDPPEKARLLETFRATPIFQQSKEKHPPGWEDGSLIADPKFARFSLDPEAENDYRLQPGSPATGKGIPLPPELEDPLAKPGAAPDIGALPSSGELFRTGRTNGAPGS